VSARFKAERLSDQVFERGDVARGGPELELGVAGRSHLQDGIVAAIGQPDAGDGLGVTAIETLREPEKGGERADDASARTTEVRIARVTPARRRAPVVAGDQRDGLDLVRFEPAQLAVLDQVVSVFVVLVVGDVHADVMQQRGVFEPLPFVIGQPMHCARLVEQADRQSRDLVGVLGGVAATLSQLDDTSQPHVGVAIGLRDLLSVPIDVIEDEAFPK